MPVVDSVLPESPPSLPSSLPPGSGSDVRVVGNSRLKAMSFGSNFPRQIKNIDGFKKKTNISTFLPLKYDVYHGHLGGLPLYTVFYHVVSN